MYSQRVQRRQRIERPGHHASDFIVIQRQHLQVVETQEHLVVYLEQFVFREEPASCIRDGLSNASTYLQFRYVQGTLECVFFDASYLIPPQIQSQQVRQPPEQAVGVYSTDFVIVQ